MSITPDVKKKIVIGILSTFAKTGASIKQVNTEYENQTGEKLAPTKSGGEEYMKSLYPDVVMDVFGRYWSKSEKSAHIQQMVAEQNTKFSPNYRGNTRIFNNALNKTFNNSRPTVSYKNDFIDVNIPPRGPNNGAAAGRINRRRMTCGPFNVSSSSETDARKRRSVTPDRERATKRLRSRSRSPPRSTRSPPGRRHRSRSRSPPKWPRRTRSRSPPSRRHRSRSRSPSRWQKQRSISPSYSPPGSPDKPAHDQRNKRSNSPSNKYSRPHHESHTSRQQGTRSPVRKPEANTRANVPHGGNNTDKNWPKSTETDTKPGKINAAKIEPVKTKKFKFTIIGDGYMFYMLSDMQSEAKFNLSMCNHTLTIADAMKMVEVQHHTLQNKKRKVMIAIGATDLRNSRSLPDMKRDFTALFLVCDKYGLKPLITTILCFDSPELKAKADLFNKFLTDCFENVIDMRAVLRCGLADVMTSLNKKHAMKLNQNSLGLGTRQQLILNVPKE